MAVFSIIKKSQLEGAKRLDAEYYQPEYLANIQKIKSSNFDMISNLLSRSIVTGTTPKRRDCRNDGTDIKFIKTDTLRVGQIVFDEADCLPVKESRKNSELKSGDIIVTIIGATQDIVGRVARVFPSDPKMNINQNVGLLRPKELSFSSYLSIFLQTKYGRGQLWQQSKQTEQVNLNCREVENVLVPLPDKGFIREIDDLVITSYNLIEQSKKIYSQAENLLLEELGLKEFESEGGLWSVVKLSEVKKANRLDAEYFQPKYENLESKIRKYKHDLLESVLENVQAGFNSFTQPNKLFNYVELSNINPSIGVIDGFSEVLGKEAPSRAKRVLKDGDVIVSSVEGSLGKVALVHKEQRDFLASTGFFQFRSKDILPEVLLVLAKSIVFQWQLEKRCAGTILTAVPKESIKDMPIPILPKPTQQKIAELVRKSHESRKKAKELLDSAKRKVEELIEKK